MCLEIASSYFFSLTRSKIASSSIQLPAIFFDSVVALHGEWLVNLLVLGLFLKELQKLGPQSVSAICSLGRGRDGCWVLRETVVNQYLAKHGEVLLIGIRVACDPFQVLLFKREFLVVPSPTWVWRELYLFQELKNIVPVHIDPSSCADQIV